VEFSKTIFQAWKFVENNTGHGKVVENNFKVVEFLQLFAQIINCNVKPVIRYALNRRQP